MSVNSELTALREAIDTKLPTDKRGKKTISQMTKSIENIQNGSGTFDIVQVTKYIPPASAGERPTRVTFSGFTDLGTRHRDGKAYPIDTGLANGVYEVTPETKDNEEIHRVYRHTSRPSITLQYSSDLWTDGCRMGWTIINPASTLALLGFDRGEIIWFMDEGYYEGEYEYEPFIGVVWWRGVVPGVGDADTHPIEVVGSLEEGVEHPDIPPFIEGYKATSYSNGKWNFSDTVSTFSNFDVPPELGNIYAATGESLIGRRIDAIQLYTADTDTVLMMDFNNGIPRDISQFRHEIRLEGGESIDDGYTGKGWNFNGGWLSATPRIYDDGIGTEFVFGDSDFTWEAYIYPTSQRRQCLFAYGLDYVFGVCFSYNEKDCKLTVFGNIDNWQPTEFSESLQLNKWYHVAVVRKGNVLYSFINFKYSGYAPIIRSVGAENNWFSIGRWGDDPSDFNAHWQGYMDDIRISNVARYEV